jgi:hypothetical protein
LLFVPHMSIKLPYTSWSNNLHILTQSSYTYLDCISMCIVLDQLVYINCEV